MVFVSLLFMAAFIILSLHFKIKFRESLDELNAMERYGAINWESLYFDAFVQKRFFKLMLSGKSPLEKTLKKMFILQSICFAIAVIAIITEFATHN